MVSMLKVLRTFFSVPQIIISENYVVLGYRMMSKYINVATKCTNHGSQQPESMYVMLAQEVYVDKTRKIETPNSAR